MLGHGSLLQRQIRHYRRLMNVYRSPPRGSTAHMMINIHQAAPPSPEDAPSVSPGTYTPWPHHRSHLHAAPPPRHDAHPNLCAAAKVKVSSSRAMRRSGGRWEACWESGSLVMYSDPQLVNTRLMLQSQQGGGARGENTIVSGGVRVLSGARVWGVF